MPVLHDTRTANPSTCMSLTALRASEVVVGPRDSGSGTHGGRKEEEGLGRPRVLSTWQVLDSKKGPSANHNEDNRG